MNWKADIIDIHLLSSVKILFDLYHSVIKKENDHLVKELIHNSIDLAFEISFRDSSLYFLK